MTNGQAVRLALVGIVASLIIGGAIGGILAPPARHLTETKWRSAFVMGHMCARFDDLKERLGPDFPQSIDERCQRYGWNAP